VTPRLSRRGPRVAPRDESVAPSDLWPSNYYVALGITTLEVARSYSPTCPAAAAWPRIGEVFRL